MSVTTDASSILGSQLGAYDLSGLDVSGAPSFGELAQKAVSGELDLSLNGVLSLGADVFFSELQTNNLLIRQLLVIAVFGALLKCLSDAFTRKSAGELGFYVTYIMMLLLAFSSFRICLGVLTEAVGALSGMMEAAVPLIIGITAISGNVAGAAVFHPALWLAMELITRCISGLFIPFTLAAAALQAVNQLAEGAPLTKLCALMKKIADWSLKGLVALFALLLTLQKISVPIVNNLALKTAKTAASAVPVVGGTLGSAMDAVLAYATAARSGVLVALVIVLCAAAAVPLIKMLAVMFTYRLAAALAQPVCDERFVNCMDQIGAYMGLLLSAGAVAAAAFIYAVVVLLSS